MDTSTLDTLTPAAYLPIIPVIAIVGVLYLVAGYRVFRLILALTGFALAGPVAAVILGIIGNGHYGAIAGGFVFGGICGAFALYFLYRTGVFCIGFLGALVLAWQVLHARPEPWAPWAVGGIALLGGLLSLGLERPVMKLATAAIGAWILTAAGGLLIWNAIAPKAGARAFVEQEPTTAIALAIGWVLLTLLGAAFQFRSRKNSPAPQPA